MLECRWSYAGRIAYGEALALQRSVHARRVAGEIPDQILFVEHPHVVTLGKTAKREHLVATRPDVDVVQTDRGGDVTYHGPGQIVGYPIVELAGLGRDLKKYLEGLEEAMIRTAADYGLAAVRRAGMTGAWTTSGKLGAIGVRVSRWVTMHGFAFNANTDLSLFDLIVPCGLRGEGVTSVRRETGRDVDLGEARGRLAAHFGDVFGRRMVHDA